ncbi:MAG: GNAT family N-acetyltransferase [Pseudonocardiales bacterium]|nr:GNAT family N-acetyltransferase [Pseudonocardiales bacterium]
MIEIRDGQPGDAHAIAAVQVESWRTAYHGLLPERVLASLSVLDRKQNWSKILSDPPPRTAILLAISNAVVVGFVAVGSDQDTTAGSQAGQLYAIYVRSDQRGRGIGTHCIMPRSTACEPWVLPTPCCGCWSATSEPFAFIVVTAGWPMVRGRLTRAPKMSFFLSCVCAVHCLRRDLAGYRSQAWVRRGRWGRCWRHRARSPDAAPHWNAGRARRDEPRGKLAAEVQGRAPDGPLDSYHSKRHLVAARALATTRAREV